MRVHRFPAFTAEASLSSGLGAYQASTILSQLGQEGSVVPALRPIIECYCRLNVCSCCWSLGDRSGCTVCNPKGCVSI